MFCELCLAHLETFPNHCRTKNELVFSIGFSLWKFHTIRLIQMPNLRAKHMEICNDYKNSKTLDEINANFEVVKSWWHSTNVAIRTYLKEFKNWLTFWHF